MSAFLATVLGLTAGQLGLLVCLTPLAGLGDEGPLMAYWPDGSTMSLARGAAVLPLERAGREQAAVGTAALAGSVLGLMLAVLSRSHHRARRRRTLVGGYLHAVVELASAGLVAAWAIRGPQFAGEPDLERQFRTAFADAIWDYLYDLQLKLYLDTVQQEPRY